MSQVKNVSVYVLNSTEKPLDVTVLVSYDGSDIEKTDVTGIEPSAYKPALVLNDESGNNHKTVFTVKNLATNLCSTVSITCQTNDKIYLCVDYSSGVYIARKDTDTKAWDSC